MRESFNALKKRVSIAMVLTHYKVEVPEVAAEQWRLHCPICGYAKRPSLSVHSGKNLFRCFHDGCHQGNILDFVVAMENVDLPRAARKIAGWFPLKKKSQKPSAQRNRALSFKLKNIDASHAGVAALGISHPEYYGVGYYSGRGKLAQRIVCPLYDATERLLAYATFDGSAQGDVEIGYPDAKYFCIDVDLYVPGIRESTTETLVIVRSALQAILLHEQGCDVVAFLGEQPGAPQSTQLTELNEFYHRCRYVPDHRESTKQRNRTVASLRKSVPEIT